MTLLKHEMKMNLKALLIWSCCIGFSCFGCLLLFGSLKDTMDQMADVYAQMGSFSAALGLDRLSISTMEGFYATEIALIFAIGGAMFAAMTGAVMLSKEEEGHTSEFLYTLPWRRTQIVWWKYASMAALIVLFQIICILWELPGFAIAGEVPPTEEYLLYHGAQLLMQIEVGSICFLISSVCKKKQIGAGLGLAVLFYLMDMMCRIVPDIEKLKYVTPYYYSNAADIFTTGTVSKSMVGIGILVAVVTAVSAAEIYKRRDLAA